MQGTRLRRRDEQNAPAWLPHARLGRDDSMVARIDAPCEARQACNARSRSAALELASSSHLSAQDCYPVTEQGMECTFKGEDIARSRREHRRVVPELRRPACMH